MNSAFRTSAPRGESDLDAVARMLSLAFAGPIEGTRQFIDNAQSENIRVLRSASAEAPLACYVRVPMGQFYGERSVPMLGIAGVAVPPESRGHGTALHLMREALREIASDGTPLSVLYASTQTLYRQVGYEQAGHRFTIRLPLDRIDIRDRSAAIRALTMEDQPAIESCYRAFSSAFDGMLDRGPYLWRRVRKNRDDAYNGFGVISDAGELIGYLFMSQRRNMDTGRHDVVLSDMAYSTPRAGRRLLGLLSDFATVGDAAIFHGGPIHPILTLMPQQRYSVEKRDYWMLRIVNLPEAIAARGYSPSAHGQAHIHVVDDLLTDNSGTWTVSVADGHGRATRGGSGPAVRVDIRALAAMYSGLYTARQARLAGLLDATESELASMEAIFQTSCPWMIDMF